MLVSSITFPQFLFFSEHLHQAKWPNGFLAIKVFTFFGYFKF